MALQHHQTGRLTEAEALYRQILTAQPHHGQALHLLGVIAHQRGDHTRAIQQIQRALQLDPTNAAAYANLGETLRHVGRLDEAAACLRRALQLDLNDAEAHANLGLILTQQGRWEEAIFAYRSALQIKPNSPEFHNDLGMALAEQGLIDDAILALRRSVELRPGYAEAWNNLGVALVRRGQFDEGIAAYHQALHHDPDLAKACNNLATALTYNGQHHEAALAYQRALKIQPDLPEAHNDIGNALLSAGYIDEAIEEYLRALALQPEEGGARNNLANAYKDAGRLDEALETYREALRVRPHSQMAHSNLIYLLHFHPDHDDESIAEEHAGWNREFAEPLESQITAHENDRDPNRRLRVGYVSPDFRSHAEACFVVPLLEAHDHGSFEIHCYASVARPDATTERLKRCANVWHNFQGLSDQHLDEQIRRNGIDILVDLTMHMADNRLQVFARKPAPVQVTWLAYPGSTGLETIDYFLTDCYLAPLENERPFYAEEAIVLPDSWCVYDPLADGLEVNELPAGKAGAITFGCLNNFCKINEPTVARFAQVLRAVPDSRLVLLAPVGSSRERFLDQFRRFGIEAERIVCIARVERKEYFKLHHQIDIALDPLPYNGITTTCDALWMGVPVMSIVGRTAAGRAGLSQLSTLGLPELVAFSDEDFVTIAAQLAADLPRLGELRRTLRERMISSPLMDGRRFARGVEAAYRSMWRRWCASSTRSSE